jgi:hypothetical protein
MNRAYENEELKAGGVYKAIVSAVRTKNFGGTDLFYGKHPQILRILGNFNAELEVFVYYSALQKPDNSLTTGESVLSVFGQAVFGVSKYSSIGEIIETNCGMNSRGSKSFAFEFVSRVDDIRFQLKGFQFTQQLVKDFS